MNMNDEIKVIIAFYACLMRLGFELGEKDHVSTIIVYPEHFIVNNGHTSGGIYHDETSILEGQSANGTVVISWQDIKQDIIEQKKDNVIKIMSSFMNLLMSWILKMVLQMVQ